MMHNYEAIAQRILNSGTHDGAVKAAETKREHRSFMPATFMREDGGHSVVHRSARPEAPWQVTRFRGETPTGHSAEDNLVGALHTAGYFDEDSKRVRKHYGTLLEAEKKADNLGLKTEGRHYTYVSPNRPIWSGASFAKDHPWVNVGEGTNQKGVVFRDKPLSLEEQENMQLEAVGIESWPHYKEQKARREFGDWVDHHKKLSNSGTSEGADKGWETKREHGTISRDHVAQILADQHHNKSAGHSADDLKDRWAPSREYHLMEIPVHAVGTATDIQHGAKSKSSGPIIVDENVNHVGRHLGNFGAAPDALVIDGKHRLAEARERGEKTIKAYVGANVKHHMEKAMSDHVSRENEAKNATDEYLKNPNGTTLRRLSLALPEHEVQQIRERRKQMKLSNSGKPCGDSFISQVDTCHLEQKQPWQMTEEEFHAHASKSPWLKINDFVEPGPDHADVRKFFSDLKEKAKAGHEWTADDISGIAKFLGYKLNGGTDGIHAAGIGMPGGYEIGLHRRHFTSSGNLKSSKRLSYTFFHELGHNVLLTKEGHHYWKYPTVEKLPEYAQEWVKANNLWQDTVGLTGGTLDSPKYHTQQTERYARLSELYFTENQKLKSVAPHLYDKFEKVLDDNTHVAVRSRLKGLDLPPSKSTFGDMFGERRMKSQQNVHAFHIRRAIAQGKLSNSGTSEGAEKGWEVKHGQRLKAAHLVQFPPVTGPNGHSLVAYQWQWKPESATNKDGDEVMKKVSDWDKADTSAETGRDLVHHFHVKDPSGNGRLVSAEGLPSALGYVQGISVPKDALKSLVSASKTLAKNKMKLAILEQQAEEYEAHKKAVDAMPVPEHEIKGEPAIRTVGVDAGKPYGTVWKLGDAQVIQHTWHDWGATPEGQINPERRQTLISTWKENRMKERGAKQPYGLYQLQQAVARQEKKVKNLATAIKGDKLPNMAPLAHLSAETDMRVARLIAQASDVFANRNGRTPSDIELLNIRRKAQAVAQFERHNAKIVNRACECTGVFCKLPEDKLSNHRFALPSDNWYHIAPTGEHPHPKGIVQVIDKESVDTMVKNFRNQSQGDPNFPGLLVDYDHVSQGGSTEAAGWITNLDGRPDGLWANIKWTNGGREKVEGGEYRLVSPVWKRKDCVPVDGDKTRCRPVVLDSLGLTNEPNMKGLKPLSK